MVGAIEGDGGSGGLGRGTRPIRGGIQHSELSIGNCKSRSGRFRFYFFAWARISSGVPAMASTMSFLGQTWAQRPQESHLL